MTTALATQQPIDAGIVEQVLIKGDLRSLSPAQKIAYYNNVCTSLGLNPLTQPFAYIVLNGKETLYAKKDATEQLRKIHEISIDPKGFVREVIEGVYIVTAPASTPSGRTDVSTGAVAIEGLKGESRANAMMKAETKAKRRVTLSICGLGMLDETEVDSIPDARPPVVVEAPKASDRPALAEGQHYILKARVRAGEFARGGDMVAVDWLAVETTYEIPDTQCARLAEALVQEGCAVTLERVKTRDGSAKVKAIHRVGGADPAAPLVQARSGGDVIDIDASDIPF